MCPDQEVFIELVAMDVMTSDILLHAKAQDTGGCDQIEIGYDPENQTVGVYSCDNDTWKTLISVSHPLSPGDVLGARLRANGMIELYDGGSLITTVSASAWPHASKGGMIGLGIYEGVGTQKFDDFGGAG
jgi:hypothetical protein